MNPFRASQNDGSDGIKQGRECRRGEKYQLELSAESAQIIPEASEFGEAWLIVIEKEEIVRS